MTATDISPDAAQLLEYLNTLDRWPTWEEMSRRGVELVDTQAVFSEVLFHLATGEMLYPTNDGWDVLVNPVVGVQVQSGNMTRREMGREAFTRKVWEQKKASRGTIIGQLQRLFDGVAVHRIVLVPVTAMPALPALGPVLRAGDDAGPAATGQEGDQMRPVIGLGADRQVVAAPGERQLAAAGGHGQAVIEIEIAFEDRFGTLEHQRVDPGLRPGAAQAGDQRRAQQHVAESAHADDEDRAGGVCRHAVGIGTRVAAASAITVR